MYGWRSRKDMRPKDRKTSKDQKLAQTFVCHKQGERNLNPFLPHKKIYHSVVNHKTDIKSWNYGKSLTKNDKF